MDFYEWDYCTGFLHSELGYTTVYASLSYHGVFKDGKDESGYYRDILEEPVFTDVYVLTEDDEEMDVVTYLEEGSDDLKRAYTALCDHYWEVTE